MGNSGIEENKAETITLTEIFEKNCPFYMSIGMTYDEYWNQDVLMAKYFKKAHVLKLKEMDQAAWLQGVYVYEAILKVSPILHAFAKSGTKPEPYSSKPYGIFDKQEKTETEVKPEIKEDMTKKLEIEKAQWFFKNWVAGFGEQSEVK